MKLATFRYVQGAWSEPFPDLDSEKTLVIAFAAPSYGDRPEVFAELAKAYPRAAVIGCSTSGEIDHTRIRDESVTVAVTRFEHTRVKYAHAPIASAEGSFAAGGTLADQLAGPELRSVLVLSRGHDVNGSELIRGLNAKLPEEVVVTGGLAGDGDRFGKTYVIGEGKPLRDAVVAIGLYGDRVRVGHGSKGGWDTFGPERVVTGSKGNVLYTLDDRPALALYKEYLGDRAAGLPGSALLFPLSLRASQDATESVVRTVLGVDEATQSMVFAGDIPTGAYAKLMRANFDRLILGAQDAGQAALRDYPPPALCVAISCVGRRLVLGERTEEETEAALDALPKGTEQIGFYSYGEISPHTTGRCDLHNQTMTLTVFSEACSRDDHPLLSRLLRKVGASAAEAPSVETWRELLGLIGRTYQESDQDRYTLERSIDISSREMQGLYQDLKRRTDTELEAGRKQVEESYAVLRATLESASEGILVVDARRNVVAVNRRYAEMMRVPDEIIASRDHLRIIAESMKQLRDPVAVRERIEEIHLTQETFHEELVLVDGRIIDRYSAPVRGQDGSPAGRVTFFRDITDQRAAHIQLQSAWSAAEAASTAKSMFLANMSHELRTPLNAVIGLADLLLLESGDPITRRQREYLEGVTQSGRHLLALVNDVLDLAKIEAGKHDLELETVGVRDAIDEALTGLVPLAHHRGVSIATEVPRAVRDVRADRLRLRQILYNLMTNALKFTDRGGTVTILARDDGVSITISVIDTGIGIAEADLPRLFQAFEQLTQPSGDRPAGTGLGLAVTRRLVDMQGGTIEVASELGVGTTFTVKLPAA